MARLAVAVNGVVEAVIVTELGPWRALLQLLHDDAGKSTVLLQADYNYRERGMWTLVMTAALDDRGGDGLAPAASGSTSRCPPGQGDLFEVIEEIEARRASRSPRPHR